MSSSEAWSGDDLQAMILLARRNEVSCRSKGLYEVAVQWQQYADALAANGECFLECQLMRRARLDD